MTFPVETTYGDGAYFLRYENYSAKPQLNADYLI